LEHWKWVNRHLVKTGRLDAVEEKEALAFLNYIFSLLATGTPFIRPFLAHSTD
jgi:hypothetical protein